jgi:purine-nucleoside phosphorylase
MVTKINETVNFLKNKKIAKPEIGIILGTGLGKLVNEINIKTELEYKQIPNFPVSTVEFHKGKLIYGKMNGKQVLAMQGRFHYYEGYSMQEITFPVRVMKELGIKYLLISNAGGAMNLDFKKGSLMLLDDHINLLGDGPLIGPNHNDLGPRFPDMSQPYSKFLNKKLERIAKEQNITLHKGVFVAVTGPNLETRAEYRFLKGIGADVVGMSTVPEVIVANHAGLPCAAISVLTDECDPDNLHPVDIKDILKTAAKAELDLIRLFSELIKKL